MSISQAEISRQVGVSRTAISHVLNGRGHMVSAETRERILKAVEANGYHRNALVRALRSNRTQMVGIVVPDAGISFFGKIIRAAERQASVNDLQCFLCQNHSLPEEMERQLAALQEYRVDGILIAPSSSNAKPDVYHALIQHKIPFVLVDVPITDVKAPFIGNDNVLTGRLAAEHLLSLGHRRIAVVRGFHENPGSQERFMGHCMALEKAGVKVDQELIVGDGFDFEAGCNAVSTLLERKVGFTALVAPSDIVALGAIRMLSKKGLRVPDDVSVIGCGNLDISSMISTSLTTIDQNSEELGHRAMDLLILQIEGKGKVNPRVIIKPKLVVRESTGVPPRSR